jgi:uncharacterized protein YbaR (Trm112 family)
MASIDPDFLKILACPACHALLVEEGDELHCTAPELECGLAYPVRNDVPVLLVEEARSRGTGSDGTND